ncbi:hypothetical protein [Saccharicrinis aurantiacus]|uniref:hypothetical protein n=1 Tax=Saccharicrinis aurantiacus TaxID=1849719 RepID=UPI00111515D8|nr:hypothetical protein [Saccharicrinis aurantiacus]
MKLDKTVKYILTSEFLFTLLPIIILLIVRSYEGNFKSLFFNTEWSIISLILFGQSVVKFSSGISNSNSKTRWQLVALTISIIIIFGLVPSSIVLVLNLTSDSTSLGLHITQIILFFTSCFTFFIVGAVGQKLLNE